MADDAGPSGSPTSDSERSLITEETQEVLSFIFSFDGAESLSEQTSELAELFTTYSMAKNITAVILSESCPSFEFPVTDVATTKAASGAELRFETAYPTLFSSVVGAEVAAATADSETTTVTAGCGSR